MNNFGLNDNYEYFEFELDSKDTTTPYDNSATSLNWPSFLLGRPLDDLAAMKILEVQIPFSFYTIDSTNNTFILHEATDLTVTIPVGSYSASSLTTALQNALNAVTTYTAGTTFTTVYTVTYNTLTQKFNITANTNVSDTFYLVFGNSTDLGITNPRTYLGFGPGQSSNPVLTGAVNPFHASLDAPFIAEITGPNYIYINSNSMGQELKLYLPEGSIGGGQLNPQMAKIPINCNPGQVIFWQTPDPQKWFDLDNSLTKIDLYCTLGATGKKLDFNGLSFSVKIGILVNRLNINEISLGLTNHGRINKRARNR